MPDAKLELHPGVYRHYKGGFYRVLTVARDSENGSNEGRELVVYVSLTYGHVCVRPREEFQGFVGEGSDRGFRFKFIGERVP
jgi:hypothetical protein